VALLYLPLITTIYARHILSKDTNMSAYFEEKRELMSMSFPRRVTKFHGKIKVKTSFRNPNSVVDEWLA
jgi:hypothetical protein